MMVLFRKARMTEVLSWAVAHKPPQIQIPPDNAGTFDNSNP